MASKLARPVGGWPIARAGETLGVSLPDGIANALGHWLDLLATWNARVDLTAARSPDELVDLMLELISQLGELQLTVLPGQLIEL